MFMSAFPAQLIEITPLTALSSTKSCATLFLPLGLLLWLLQLHLELLPLLSPSSSPPTPQPGGAWGVMASDIPEAGPTRAVRLALMHSLRWV